MAIRISLAALLYSTMVKKKLLDQVTDIARFRHLSIRTEEAYRNWIKRFILFHGKRHPRELDADAIRAFLKHLAVTEQVAAATQYQAFGTEQVRRQMALHKKSEHSSAKRDDR